jgi:hypothetical protein
MLLTSFDLLIEPLIDFKGFESGEVKSEIHYLKNFATYFKVVGLIICRNELLAVRQLNSNTNNYENIHCNPKFTCSFGHDNPC